MKIVIQAGGKGTRLEGLTRNKPKCLVPVNNLPIIFYAFQKFKDAEFTIIADYKTDVLEKYLNAFGSQYNFKIVKAIKKGTISGIKEAIADYKSTLKYAPEMTIAYYSLGVDYDALNNYQSAKENYQKYIDLTDEDNDFKNYAQTRIKEIQ